MAFPVADGVELVALPPPGRATDPAHPQQHGQVAVYAAFAACTTLSTGFLGMRLYTNALVTKRLGIEDYLMVASFAVALTTKSLAIWFIAEGAGGVHIWEMSVNTFNKWMLWDHPAPDDLDQSAWIFTCIYVFCSSFAKLSVLLLCLRAHAGQQQRPPASPPPGTTTAAAAGRGWYRACVVGVMALVVGYALGVSLACVFACRPFRKAFDARVRGGRCVSQGVLNVATALWNLATEPVVLLLALRLVPWGRLARRERWVLCGFLAVVSFTISLSAVRTVHIFQVFHSTDITWESPHLVIWTLARLDLTVVCGCLPAVRDFVHHVCPRLRPQREQQQEQQQQQHHHHGGGEAGARRPGVPLLLGGWWRSRLSGEKRPAGYSSSTGALSTGRSGKSLVGSEHPAADPAPMRGQGPGAVVVVEEEEDPARRVSRCVHQQATRDYHSHLYQTWWDQA